MPKRAQEADSRPVDQVWPERKAAIKEKMCSVGEHPVSDQEYASWKSIDQCEYNISGCCPNCFSKLMPEEDDD